MKNTAVVLLLLAIHLTATAKQHKTRKSAAGNELVSVETSHTACFGRCPQFKIELNKNGMVTYTGIRFVHDSGVYTKNIGRKKAAYLVSRFTTYRADTCKDLYESRMTDMPGINITLRYRTKTKEIRNSNLGPEGLIRISAPIDSLAIGKLDNTWNRAISPGDQ